MVFPLSDSRSAKVAFRFRNSASPEDYLIQPREEHVGLTYLHPLNP
jgi:hypothetical protein